MAGALVSDDLIFSSNRGENTVGIFRPGPNPKVAKVKVGLGPNGLAYDAARRLLLAANIGDPAIAGSHTLSMVDVDGLALRGNIEVPGRTRWTVYDPERQLFYVNIADPALIVMVDARKPEALSGSFAIPAAGPHGLDFDPDTQRLFCACDNATLVTLDARTGKVLDRQPISGIPDVIFFHRQRRQLYVAVGNPGVIDVFDTQTSKRTATVVTEAGAHTTALAGDTLYAFLPQTHRAAVYRIAGENA